LRVPGRSIKAFWDAWISGRFSREFATLYARALQQEAAISDILTAQKGPIFEITLNRPQDGNAASDDMAEELTRLLLGAESAEIIVLRGAGADFCIGRSTAGRRPASNSADALERRFGSDVVFDCYNAFRRTRAPVIGVVRGRALGFGCAIAAVCDITIAADNAQFQIPEMLHNIMPTMVMSALVDRVPRKAMTYFVYSTAMISAARAREAGLVSEVVPAAELDAAVETLCATMMKAPQPARLGVKEYTRTALDMSIAGAIDYARNLHSTLNAAAAMRPKPK
jgi:enoyl-CoA hydratase